MSKVVEINKFTVVIIIDNTIVELLIERSSIRIGVEILISDLGISSEQEEGIAPSEDHSYVLTSFIEAGYSSIRLIEA